MSEWKIDVKFNFKWFLIGLAAIVAAALLKLLWTVLMWLFWPLVIILVAYVVLNVAGKVPGPFRK